MNNQHLLLLLQRKLYPSLHSYNPQALAEEDFAVLNGLPNNGDHYSWSCGSGSIDGFVGRDSGLIPGACLRTLADVIIAINIVVNVRVYLACGVFWKDEPAPFAAAAAAVIASIGGRSRRCGKRTSKERRKDVPATPTCMFLQSLLSGCPRCALATKKGLVGDMLRASCGRSEAEALLHGPVARRRPVLPQLRRFRQAQRAPMQGLPALATRAVLQR